MLNIHEILRIVRLVREIYQPAGSEYPDATVLSMTTVFQDVDNVKGNIVRMKAENAYSRGIGDITKIGTYAEAAITEQALVIKIEWIVREGEK